MSLPTYEEALKPSYWTKLVPGLLLDEEAPRPTPPAKLSPEMLADLRRQVLTEGYFELPDHLDTGGFPPLLEAVDRLRAEGWLPVFGYMYNDYWNLYAQLREILEYFLGAGYQQIPTLWVWRVGTDGKQAGWKPHRDNPQSIAEDGSPMALSVWLPFTEANPLNGCMYLLPIDRDPSRDDPDSANLDFQNLRAIPAKPGTVLGWSQQVYHWGGRGSHRAKHPRISTCCEFQRGDVAPFQKPLVNPHTIPNFRERLRMVATQVLYYQHMHKITPELEALCKGLMKNP